MKDNLGKNISPQSKISSTKYNLELRIKWKSAKTFTHLESECMKQHLIGNILTCLRIMRPDSPRRLYVELVKRRRQQDLRENIGHAESWK